MIGSARWRSLGFAVVMLVPQLGWAQEVPHRISFSGYLADGDAPATGIYDLRFALYDQRSQGGAACDAWVELHPAVRVESGVVFVELGALTPLPTSCFTGAPLYLEVSVDGTVLAPRLSLGTSAYAIRAEVAGDAESVGGLAADDLLTAGSSLACSGDDKMVGIDRGSGNVVCATDRVIPDTNAGTLCQAGQYLEGGGTCRAGYLDADGVDATAATICGNASFLNGDGTCDPADGSGDCSAGSVCTGGHSHSDKLGTSGGTISGSLTVTGNLDVDGAFSWGGNRFGAATRGYLAVTAYSGYSCDTVCNAHSLDCSAQVGPYTFPAMTTTTCSTTTGDRLCSCWR